ncbi:MAG: hypothetical protein NUV72_00420 [Bauldia sp.]|nr:hypothetical protein [Bauldia sp.]
MTGRNALPRIVVAPAAGDRRRGMIVAGTLCAACALGRAGAGRLKREGDG